MKLFAKCSAFASLSFQEYVKVCYPIRLNNFFLVSIVCVFSFIAYIRDIYNKV